MTLLDLLTTSYTTTTCLVEDSSDIETAYTTASTVVTTLFDGDPKINLSVKATNDYIDSLSVEQLAEFDEMLSQKENELDLGNGQKAIIPGVNTSEDTKSLRKVKTKENVEQLIKIQTKENA